MASNIWIVFQEPGKCEGCIFDEECKAADRGESACPLNKADPAVELDSWEDICNADKKYTVKEG